MSMSDLFLVAITFFVCAFAFWVYSWFKKNEKPLALKAGIAVFNKLAAIENMTPDQQAKAAADEAHTQALKNALKDAAARL